MTYSNGRVSRDTTGDCDTGASSRLALSTRAWQKGVGLVPYFKRNFSVLYRGNDFLVLTVVALVSSMSSLIQSNHGIPGIVVQCPSKSVVMRG